MLRWIVRGLLLLPLAGLIVVGWASLQGRDFLAGTPSSEHEERVVEIPRGAGPRTVSNLLAEAGVVTDAEKFHWFLRWRKAASGLRAGEFQFWTDQTPDQVLERLLSGAEVTYPITLPPGLRIEDMAERVEAAGRGSAARYVQLARDSDFIAGLEHGLASAPSTLEGLLVPETYSFGRDANEESVIRAQVKRFGQLWDDRRRARAEQLGLSPYEVVTLASVVEKETGAPHERPLIAGVFHNRLKKRMRLESDPTIIYGLVNYDGDIRRADIRRPHPWNTYVIKGLPPTPIAAPGVEAIDAVLWPEETKALFFVSRNDGTHHFSETYAEHARMVNEYQRRRRRR